MCFQPGLGGIILNGKWWGGSGLKCLETSDPLEPHVLLTLPAHCCTQMRHAPHLFTLAHISRNGSAVVIAAGTCKRPSPEPFSPLSTYPLSATPNWRVTHCKRPSPIHLPNPLPSHQNCHQRLEERILYTTALIPTGPNARQATNGLQVCFAIAADFPKAAHGPFNPPRLRLTGPHPAARRP